jgi:hypothetical protein
MARNSPRQTHTSLGHIAGWCRVVNLLGGSLSMAGRAIDKCISLSDVI